MRRQFNIRGSKEKIQRQDSIKSINFFRT